MKKIILLFVFLLCSVSTVKAQMTSGIWHNDLRTMFLKNKTIICAINIRTFNAKDTNKNEIIDLNEERGNFINAIDRLDEIQQAGINTIHVLPITSVGKIKAFGTAGSLYAIENFSKINPQLKDENSTLSLNNQAKKFISECHKRNIRVIIDLPSCGSYDMFIEHPEFFVKDDSGQPIIPLDWNDIRVLNVGDENKINEDLYNEHKKFIDLILSLGADGLRADVASMKPYIFWEKLIKYTRDKDPEFMFLAEASNDWVKPTSGKAPFTKYDALLSAGFDGYYGNYFNLKNWKTSDELFSGVKFNQKIQKEMNKSVIGSFTTHDEVSPILLKGSDFSKMIIWLNTTLPLNAYYVDGFYTGDDYNYCWANKYAAETFTDDEYYFNHKGQFDIFNFSRKPGGGDYSIYQEFVLANKFKQHYANDLSTMKFVPLKTSDKRIFAYMRTGGEFNIVVIGNLDFNNSVKTIVKCNKIKSSQRYINLRVTKNIFPEIKSGKIYTELSSGDIQVLMFKNL